MKLCTAFLAALVCAAPAAAQDRPSIESVLASLDRVHSFSETAITPDGARVAWVEELTANTFGGASAIWVKDLPAGTPRRVSAAAGATAAAHESQIAWSWDGKSLAFLSNAENPAQAQLYVTDTTAAPRRVTNVRGQLAHPIWSRDGKHIAVLFVAGSAQPTGALVAHKQDAGVVGDDTDEQRITIVDVASGAAREASPANMFVYDYDWSPDNTWFAAEAAPGSGTNNYWIAGLYRVPADGSDTRPLWKPPLQIAVPRIAPDGNSVAVIHGIMSDEGSNGGDVYVVPATGAEPRNVTPRLEGSARGLAWTSRGQILINEYLDGKSAVVRVLPGSGERVLTWSAPQQVTSVSASADGLAVSGVVQSFTEAPEVYAGPAGQWTRQTNTNTAIKPSWGEARSLHWRSGEHTPQGWLVYPASFNPSQRYPMVVSVHGGPSSASTPSWPVRWNAVLPSQGYFLFLPNPRGSYGMGEDFAAANVKDFGYGDLRDILEGVEAAIKEAPIDTNRVGITGWSYGGYMTMWAVTQTTRFKAAVAGAGIANWQSYYGQNRIDQWMIPFFGASVYDDPAVYARSSPITYIKKVKTPTLVLHGDRDSEVPTPQGYEFWHALKELNVPTQLVIYPNEGHAIVDPAHQRDIEQRMVAWFDKWMK